MKVCVRLKGREISKTGLGFELLEKFKECCEEFATFEKPAKAEGKNITLIMSPKMSDQKTQNSKLTEENNAKN